MAPKNKSFASDILGATNPALSFVSGPATDVGAGMAEATSTEAPKPIKKGRPFATREKKDKRVSLVFYPSVWERLLNYTERTGESPNSFINRLVKETLDKKDKEEFDQLSKNAFNQQNPFE